MAFFALMPDSASSQQKLLFAEMPTGPGIGSPESELEVPSNKDRHPQSEIKGAASTYKVLSSLNDFSEIAPYYENATKISQSI